MEFGFKKKFNERYAWGAVSRMNSRTRSSKTDSKSGRLCLSSVCIFLLRPPLFASPSNSYSWLAPCSLFPIDRTCDVQGERYLWHPLQKFDAIERLLRSKIEGARIHYGHRRTVRRSKKVVGYGERNQLTCKPLFINVTKGDWRGSLD